VILTTRIIRRELDPRAVAAFEQFQLLATSASQLVLCHLSLYREVAYRDEQTGTARPSLKGHDQDMNENLHYPLDGLLASLLSGRLPQSLRWSDVVELIEHLGRVEAHGDHEFLFLVGAQRVTFKRPQNRKLDFDDISRLRKFLTGVGPEIAIQDFSRPSRAIVVIDHHAAHIYQIFGGRQRANEHTIRPHNPFGVHHHQIQRAGSHDGAETIHERNVFYEDVARDLSRAREVVIIGHGKGDSSAATYLNQYLKSCHPGLFQRVIATEGLDLSAVTVSEREPIAKKQMIIV